MRDKVKLRYGKDFSKITERNMKKDIKWKN
jgi:hypothetical protein